MKGTIPCVYNLSIRYCSRTWCRYVAMFLDEYEGQDNKMIIERDELERKLNPSIIICLTNLMAINVL